MCGDLEEDEGRAEQLLLARFLAHARVTLAQHPSSAAPKNLNSYLDTLYADVLSRSMRDCEDAEPAQRYERLAMQPVVLARLAGFLAAHLNLEEDPLRKVIEAMMAGYAEAELLDREQAHHHHGDVVARN